MASLEGCRCLVRHKIVAMTAEEEVRQKLLRLMLGDLGYPKALVAVEKRILNRRFDIVCFDRKMKPLLLIECKAETITQETLSQALGYNSALMAPFICLCSSRQIRTFWQEGANWVSCPFLPKFHELLTRSVQ